ncbi:PIG-L family deacetylase [Rhodanobacter sp. AS-Z3]|nr:PIG-L family deacetylase [Rhodanobacter sp. AS-Z3]WEN16854.1 PIG-L family deacetylase [Rhodanobacter sp. AS-Z3]
MLALPPFSSQTRLLVVAPHPDDETIANGLLIQQVRAAGGEVRVLLLTAGDNNPWPQRWLERRLCIGVEDRRRWAQRRQSEFLQALRCLGLSESDQRSLGWPDMGLTEHLLQECDAAVAALLAAINEFQPSLLLVPALSDHHPDHGAAHVLLRLALAEYPASPVLLTYLVHGVSGDGDVFEVVGTAAQRTAKFAALAAHRSQMALSGKRMRRMASRAECSAAPAPSQPALPWQPPIWLQPWLQLSVVSAAGTQRWRWRDAPLRRDACGRWRLPAASSVHPGPTFARLAFTLPTPWIFDHWGWCELS